MRYTLKNGSPCPVRQLRHLGFVISNPPDSLVDKLAAGFPCREAEKPEYDPDTQRLRAEWVLEDGALCQKWRVEERQQDPTEARLLRLEAALEVIQRLLNLGDSR